MTAATWLTGAVRTTVRPAPPATRRTLLVLARTEARRMLRSPWLLLGVVAAVLLFRDLQQPQKWSGEHYGTWTLVPVGLYLATSLVVASSFHRERAALAGEAPVGAGLRCAARLLAALTPVAVTALCVAGVAAHIRSIDGFDLGHEPGRTLHAFPTAAELFQPIALAVLAVAAGALAGRRLRHRATAVLLLVLGWLPVTMTYWAFQSRYVAPFSILQSQPVSVDVGPPSTDPLTFPEHWLLEGPGDYQDHWARLVVSEPLAWSHSGWLLGLAALLLAGAVPAGPPRRWLIAGGALVAAVSVAVQLTVYPS